MNRYNVLLSQLYMGISATLIIPAVYFCANFTWYSLVLLLFLLPHKIKRGLRQCSLKKNLFNSITYIGHQVHFYFCAMLVIGIVLSQLSWIYFVVIYPLIFCFVMYKKLHMFNPVMYYILDYDYYLVRLTESSGSTFMLCTKEYEDEIKDNIVSGRGFNLSMVSRGRYIC